jgi:peroxin-16
MVLKSIVKKVVGILFNSDILHIIRPFVYIFLVMKHGKKSWVPIQVSLAMDLLIIFLVFLKLIGA